MVAQGFLEAWWLTAGRESSPVLRQEPLRALIFGGGIDDEFACNDVSTAFLQASAYIRSMTIFDILSDMPPIVNTCIEVDPSEYTV